jgi:hypothetical protein
MTFTEEKRLPKILGYFVTFEKKNVQRKQSPNRRKLAKSGTDVMILKIFSPKKIAKNRRF